MQVCHALFIPIRIEIQNANPCPRVCEWRAPSEASASREASVEIVLLGEAGPIHRYLPAGIGGSLCEHVNSSPEPRGREPTESLFARNPTDPVTLGGHGIPQAVRSCHNAPGLLYSLPIHAGTIVKNVQIAVAVVAPEPNIDPAGDGVV